MICCNGDTASIMKNSFSGCFYPTRAGIVSLHTPLKPRQLVVCCFGMCQAKKCNKNKPFRSEHRNDQMLLDGTVFFVA